MNVEEFFRLCLALLDMQTVTIEQVIRPGSGTVYTLREATRQFEVSFPDNNPNRNYIGPYYVSDQHDLTPDARAILHKRVVAAAERRWEEQRIDAFENASLLLKRLTDPNAPRQYNVR